MYLYINLEKKINPQDIMKQNDVDLTRREIDYTNALLIDRTARIFFPIAWIAFILFYFFYLLEIHKHKQHVNPVL